MLVNTVHGQSHGLSEERAGGQRYETMQCFALTQPRAMMEEGEGNVTADDFQPVQNQSRVYCPVSEGFTLLGIGLSDLEHT